MENLKIGSSGSDVEKLQKALIDAGYDVGGTGADGILGKNTEAAIKQYQKDNGLVVDGIAGKNTLGSLYGSNTPAPAPAQTPTPAPVPTPNASATSPSQAATNTPVTNTPVVPNTPVTSPAEFTYGDFTYADFDPMANEQIKQAWDILQQNNASRPGAWTDPYLDQYMGYLDQYANRGPFSYDVNSDALYQQYKDQYIQQGRMAMMDTMGQAAAMTGGYGNSYAQSVGQQAYNQHLNQLNEIIPELYGMAYDRYVQEGQDMLNMYNLYKGLSDQSYDRHQGALENWYREDARLADNFDSLYDKGWNEYLLDYNTSFNEHNTDRSEAFSKWQTEQNQAFTAEQAQKELDWKEKQAALDRDDKKKETAKNDLIDLITGTGYDPTDAELQAAGMTRSQADGYQEAYKQSMSKTEDTGWRNVSSTSIEDIVNTVYKYGQKGENGLMEKYLDGLVGEGRISQDYADELYAAFKKDEELKPGDTTVGIIPNYDQKWLRDPKLR